MSSSSLYRFAGYAALVAGICVAVGEVIHPPIAAANVTTGTWAISHLLLFASLILGIAAMFGLYARQRAEVGGVGFLGFVAIFLGMCAYLGIVFFEAFISAAVAQGAPEFAQRLYQSEPGGGLGVVLMLGSVLFVVGWLGFGVTTARAGVLPAAAAFLATAGAVLLGLELFLPPAIGKIGAVLFGAGLAWLGIRLSRPAEGSVAGAAAR
jgi:hypothetical protein